MIASDHRRECKYLPTSTCTCLSVLDVKCFAILKERILAVVYAPFQDGAGGAKTYKLALLGL